MSNILEKNDYFNYSGYTTRYPYVQISIVPNDKYDKKTIKNEAKKITEEIFSQLKKYEYKSGGIIKYNYEYISLYFSDYNQYGQLSRNEGPFVQFKIYDIDKIKSEDFLNKKHWKK